MCGIAGIISTNTSKVTGHVLNNMAACMAHRGPDGQATWINGEGKAGFAHRRLCVIDLSNAAAQPMHYRSRYTIIYNGEIYNYVELREQLTKKGHTFKTASDTETILGAYAEYGEECLSHFDGMFAFALWDEQEKILFCARDRFGEKPFYYAQCEGLFFASEVNALMQANIATERDNGMLMQFLISGNTIDAADNSRTFYKNIKKLPAAHYLTYHVNEQQLRVKRYWKVDIAGDRVIEREAVERIHELLTVSVSRRLRSDVAIGASLSGGLDSSGVVSYLSAAGVKKLDTFTARFPGFDKNEEESAMRVSFLSGYNNYGVVPTADELAGDFEKLAFHHDVPVASASIYAQYRVYRLAADQNVTVLLDGQGADEVFGGYDHYRSWGLRAFAPRTTARILEMKEKRKAIDYPFAGDEFLYEALKEVSIRKPVVRSLNHWLHFDSFCQGLEQLLTYADRNSMAHGREVRLPYLSHELVAYLFSLHGSLKIRRGFTKWILRKLMENKLPRELVWTKQKIGFEPPQKLWMQNKLVSAYIMEQKQKLVREKILKKIVLDQRLASHDAYDVRATDWRWMAVSAFLNKKGV
jgi:asparagine synthase (glutamine-hydrolysing)